MRLFYIILFTFILTNVKAQCILTGKVVSENQSSPKVSKATIYIPQLNKVIKCDTNGFFKFYNLPKGNFNIHATASGYQSHIVNWKYR